MANPNTTNSLKPAQILLTEGDRALAAQIADRVERQGGRSPGPTAMYRAGLLALRVLDDEVLAKTFDQVEGRPSHAALSELFQQWCGLIARRVRTEPSLQHAWRGEDDPTDCGHFGQGGRFVSLSYMSDGRVLISGLGAVVPAVPPPQPLFPGGTATLLTMNAQGADLAARAIVAWLRLEDNELPAIRAAIGNHRVEPLR